MAPQPQGTIFCRARSIDRKYFAHRLINLRGCLQKTGTPPAEGASATTITYNFAADRPGTFTYHARYGRDRDRAAALVDVLASKAGTDAGHGIVNLPRRDDGISAAGCRARTADARHVVAANVPRSDQGPPTTAGRASKPASTAVRRVDGSAWGRWGIASVEAQLMADCPVIHYDRAEYDEGPSVRRLLRWSGATLAAAALWVSDICGPRDPDLGR
jgi:hypothetical protein